MDYSTWIEAYVIGDLSEAQRKEMEAAMAQSAPLRQEVELTARILAAFKAEAPDPAVENLVQKIAAQHRDERNRQFGDRLGGRLSPQESQTFDECLMSDELFAYEWEEFQRAHARQPRGGAINEPVKVFANILKASPMIWTRLAIAASVALLVGFLGWHFWAKERRENQILYAQHNLPALRPSSKAALAGEGVTHRGDGLEIGNLKSEGLQAYDDARWNEAVRLLSEYVKTIYRVQKTPTEEVDLLYLFIGRALMELDKVGDAIKALRYANEKITDMINYSLIKEQIYWNLALAYLKNNDRDDAKKYLRMLMDATDEKLRHQALTLLTALS